MTEHQTTATEKCEEILRKSMAYNIAHSILPSENGVIDRLLNNKENMKYVYAELSKSLNEQQIEVFLSLVLSCAAFWNPKKAATYRTERKELFEVNRQIAKVAQQLVGLLERRDELHNHSGFSSGTHYSIINVIENASKDNFLYRSYIKKPLSHIKHQFDLKYWPSIEEVVAEVGLDAGSADIYATDSLTEASTASSRPSKIDFLRALFSALQENSGRKFGLIPENFELSDNSISEVMNCALQLDHEELVDASYVKRERQRQREQQKKMPNKSNRSGSIVRGQSKN
ncbi:MAG: hypothetical protein H6995_04925 [Pseudomonadales bacterium]|nr:hypothetical protein [Pseudomonadales bacterium]